MTLRPYTRMRSVSAKRQRQQSVEASVRKAVMERAAYRCEVTLGVLEGWSTLRGWLSPGRCPRRAVEVHHVLKRSQGGATEADNLIAICRACHERTDFPYQRGRLVILPLGHGQFACALRYAADKWTGRA